MQQEPRDNGAGKAYHKHKSFNITLRVLAYPCFQKSTSTNDTSIKLQISNYALQNH